MNTKKIQTIHILSENHPSAIYRIVGIFLRRKIIITRFDMHVAVTNTAEFTIEISETKELTEKIQKQIEKIIEVKQVNIL